MPRLRHFALSLLFALSVLVGQHAATAHAIGHAADEVEQGSSLPATKTCLDHSLYVPFAGALAASVPVAPFVAAAVPSDSQVAARDASLPPRYAFHSRAPPASPA